MAIVKEKKNGSRKFYLLLTLKYFMFNIKLAKLFKLKFSMCFHIHIFDGYHRFHDTFYKWFASTIASIFQVTF